MIKDVFYFTQYNKLFESDDSDIGETQTDKDVNPSEKESQTPKDEQIYKVGDMVDYKRRTYNDDLSKEEQDKDAIATGEIKKIIRGGKKYRIYNNNIDREFTKYKDDILGKSSNKSDIEIDPNAIVMGDEEILEKIYSNNVYKFGTI